MRCPYCGNSSGRTDQRGMCISCGGNLAPIELVMKVPDYWMGEEYNGVSGGWSQLTRQKYSCSFGVIDNSIVGISIL